MIASQELSKSDQRVVAWEKHKRIEEFDNIVKWIKQGHYAGELWTIFLHGTIAPGHQKVMLSEVKEEMEKKGYYYKGNNPMTDFRIRLYSALEELYSFESQIINMFQAECEENEKLFIDPDKYGGLWGSHPDYSRGDWQCEAMIGDTQLGYWDWVRHRVDEVRFEKEVVDIEKLEDA